MIGKILLALLTNPRKLTDHVLRKFHRSIFTNAGFCPACQKSVLFSATNRWFRDYYRCSKCGSIPRERALMQVLQLNYPEWPSLTIHESSPNARGASKALAHRCHKYIGSHYLSDVAPGTKKGAIRCENLESLTFPDESIDIHVSQDVLEHVFNPRKAFAEVARTLKPGGAHIFTAPLVRKSEPSQPRAIKDAGGTIVFMQPPEYHGNPIDPKGSLVVTDWGFDIVDYIREACALETEIVTLDDLDLGIRAEYIEVLITRKPPKQIANNLQPNTLADFR